MNATSEGPARPAWSAKAIAIAAFFVLFLSIQTAVPLVKLFEPRPARFGWQMFTAKPQRVRFTLVMHDGTKKPVDLRQYVGHSRGEVSLESALPQHLCRVVPNVDAVQITAVDSNASRVHPCR
jgi:hypothetical protein